MKLLELRGRGTLTDAATRVLEQILDERSVSLEDRERLAATARAERGASQVEEASTTNSLASLGSRLGTQFIDLFIAMAVALPLCLIALAFPVMFVIAAIAYVA